MVSYEPVLFDRDVEVIQIPDGTPIVVPRGSNGWVMQVLGGNFTVRLETGHLIRVNGEHAEAIGQEVPPEALAPVLTEGEFDVEQVWDQLRLIYDPEIPVNIVDLGLVYDCQVAAADGGDRTVTITMTLTAPGCGMGQVLADDVETRVKAVPGVSQAVVDLVFDPPWSPERMSEAAQLELGFF